MADDNDRRDELSPWLVGLAGAAVATGAALRGAIRQAVPGVQSAPPGSTCFSSLTYNPSSQEVTMEFIRGGTYVIEGFSSDTWDQWVNSGSLGSFFNTRVKGRY